jgi:HD superfamily phosphohydrolase
MQFLRTGLKSKIVRTRLYGDQEFTRFELELFHTPTLQRLYGLKQLGFADRVFPDAIHSRFNHILGVTDVVQRMADRLLTWLDAHKLERFEYRPSVRGESSSNAEITGGELYKHLTDRIPALRLMALLHDVTHGPFGHTLEDEVQVFHEKHDAQERQVRFFNALIAQLLYLWVTEERLHEFDGSIFDDLSTLSVNSDFKQEIAWAQELAAYLETSQRVALARHLSDLELALRLLLLLDFSHGHDQTEPQSESLLVTKVVEIIGRDDYSLDFVPQRDLFMVDLVGNTICADLLDYARRDADNAGLRIQFDDRFLRYLCVVSVKDQYSPTREPAIRAAIQIFTDKMRHDVLSELSGILKARYLINERVLFHPKKCAAGAMLGTAVQLLGLKDLPHWMQVLGDVEFLATLSQLAASVEAACPKLAPGGSTDQNLTWADIVKSIWPADARTASLVTSVISLKVPSGSERLSTADVDIILARTRGARRLLGRLNARRLPKLAYRIRTMHHSGGTTDTTIADKYNKANERYKLERRVEEVCNLPIGSVVVHCPIRKTSMKVAQALVVGSDLRNVAQLREVTKISSEGLAPYQDEILAVEKMYESIWQFHAFLDPTFWYKQPIVELVFEKELGGIPNDRLLSMELAQEQEGIFALLAGELYEEVAPKHLQRVVELVDAETTGKMRHGRDQESNRDILRRIIGEVNVEQGTTTKPKRMKLQRGLPGVE